MNKNRLITVILLFQFILCSCGQQEAGVGNGASEAEKVTEQTEVTGEAEGGIEAMGHGTITDGKLPEELVLIPQDYFTESGQPGTPDKPGGFKNVLDHAMEEGKIQPMIIVCPTYNNESETDSSDYSLAIRLTDHYHNELVNDLIPAVEGTYSTYAEDTTLEGIRASRDHRAFCGFSMGAVATWRTFQYCLDYFRYFMPSSGNLTSDGDYMASIVRESGHEWNDFFIFAASGTDDFAYSSFKYQIEAMAGVNDGTFRYADNEAEGNLYFLEQEGGTHSGEYAMEYFYNGLCWIWQ